MSNEIWLTSDHHFGHRNILEYEKEARPFKTLEEMHEVMIDRWNSVVGVQDTVYHLGDFCFGKQWLYLASRLQGKKKLIMGNHDAYCSNEYLKYFERLHGVKYLEQIVLSHMPIHQHGLGRRWWVNAHGHLHSKKVMLPKLVGRKLEENSVIEDPHYFNVSVEHHNLTPVNIELIRERMKRIKDEEEK